MFVSGEIERMHERDRDCACGDGEHCRKVINELHVRHGRRRNVRYMLIAIRILTCASHEPAMYPKPRKLGETVDIIGDIGCTYSRN